MHRTVFCRLTLACGPSLHSLISQFARHKPANVAMLWLIKLITLITTSWPGFVALSPTISRVQPENRAATASTTPAWGQARAIVRTI